MRGHSRFRVPGTKRSSITVDRHFVVPNGQTGVRSDCAILAHEIVFLQIDILLSNWRFMSWLSSVSNQIWQHTVCLMLDTSKITGVRNLVFATKVCLRRAHASALLTGLCLANCFRYRSDQGRSSEFMLSESRHLSQRLWVVKGRGIRTMCTSFVPTTGGYNLNSHIALPNSMFRRLQAQIEARNNSSQPKIGIYL